MTRRSLLALLACASAAAPLATKAIAAVDRPLPLTSELITPPKPEVIATLSIQDPQSAEWRVLGHVRVAEIQYGQFTAADIEKLERVYAHHSRMSDAPLLAEFYFA